jgi:NTP pyrophosphatase (non-canonical NTP hydrolase)
MNNTGLYHAIDLLEEWHNERNIPKGSTSKDKLAKLIQEVGELSDSICKGQPIIDDVGDILTVLLSLVMEHDLNFGQCLMHSYMEIRDRKGKMIDGVYVKEEDLEKMND